MNSEDQSLAIHSIDEIDDPNKKEKKKRIVWSLPESDKDTEQGPNKSGKPANKDLSA